MGQYYIVVNLDKQQYIHPRAFGDGAKLMEFGCSGPGMMTALAILLADGNGRGLGDLRTNSTFAGAWSGDRIVVAGDYADGGKFLPDGITREELTTIAKRCFNEGYQDPEEVNLYTFAFEQFEDISRQIIDVLCGDEVVLETLAKELQGREPEDLPDAISNFLDDATDERCQCGHLKSQHADRYQPGHGPCKECGCKQFTFVGFVTSSQTS